jgi:hypothetical protein
MKAATMTLIWYAAFMAQVAYDGFEVTDASALALLIATLWHVLAYLYEPKEAK